LAQVADSHGAPSPFGEYGAKHPLAIAERFLVKQDSNEGLEKIDCANALKLFPEWKLLALSAQGSFSKRQFKT